MKLRQNLLKRTSMLVVTAAISGGATVSQSAELEEIIVTATKRAESVQDVGLSIQAFDENSLKQGGVTDVSRLDALISGVNYAFVGNDAKFNVRGSNSSNTFGDATSVVGVFVDGVYKPRASQQTRAFFDVERLEFLKGPQGTLYGRNTFAGAMNLYTKAASVEDGVTGYAELGLESFDRVKLQGAINLPVNDKLAFRLAATSDKSDGYIKNLSGSDVGAQDDKSFRISAKYLQSDSVDWTLRVQHSEEDGREAGLFGYTYLCRREAANGLTDPFGPVRNCSNPSRGGAVAGAPGADQLGGHTITQDYTPEVDLVEDSITLEGNFDFGAVSLKSITNYTDFENLIGFDSDFSSNPNQISGYDETVESVSQEFTLTSNSDGPVQWTAGLYYSKDEQFNSFSLYQATQRDDGVRGTAIAPNGAALTLLTATPIVSRDISIGGFFGDANFREAVTTGIYGEAEWSISDNLRLTAGLRYSEEDKDLNGAGSNFTGDTNGDGVVDPLVRVLIPNGASPAQAPAFSRSAFAINPGASDAITQSEKYDNTTYRLGLEYDFESGALFYANYATGFLSGAVNAGGATEEQESTVLEIGYKSFLFDNSLKLNVAAHMTEYDNLLTQLQIPNAQTGVVQTISVNGGDIEAKGIELEAVYLPNDNLSLGFNFAYLDSEYGTFGVSNPYQLWNGRVRPFIDLKGEVTPWSPEITFTLSASYRIDLGSNGSITPYVQLYSSDDYGTSNIVGTDPNQLQDSFTKTDFRLTWEDADSRYSVEAFVENIEDEAVLARGNNNGDDIVQTGFLYPRNAGIRIRANF